MASGARTRASGAKLASPRIRPGCLAAPVSTPPGPQPGTTVTNRQPNPSPVPVTHPVSPGRAMPGIAVTEGDRTSLWSRSADPGGGAAR